MQITVLRYYLVAAIKAGKPEKIKEFFSLHGDRWAAALLLLLLGLS